MRQYYNGSKLLNMLDINGNKPEIFIVSGNRTGGKTTYFNRKLVQDFIDDNSKKFCVLYRNGYEVEDCAEKFFRDIQGLFFKDYIMTSEKLGKKFMKLKLNDVDCGYAVALRDADKVKQYSHFFSDCKVLIFDEFQSESDSYVPKEVEKFQSIHTSIARGNGEQVRYLPVYMISNSVSIINPYYNALDISKRLKSDTKFLRGDGFVLECNFNEIAKEAQLKSGFNRAFSGSNYNKYSMENIYLNDNIAFITNVEGKNEYIATLKYEGKMYGVRIYKELGIWYVSESVDITHPLKFAVTVTDIDEKFRHKTLVLKFVKMFREAFKAGALRFQNLYCKNCFIDFVNL